MFGRLIPSGGGLPIPLLAKVVTVGRSPKCDVVVPSRAISSRHCELSLREDYWWVKDLESRNGVGINGKRCREKRILPDQILCLPKIRFQVAYELPSGGRNASDESLAMRALSAADARSQQAKSKPVDTKPVPKAAAVPPSTAAPGEKRFRGKLVPLGGGDPIPLLDATIVVGRSRDTEIRIKKNTVSSKHCRLTYDDGYWLVEDLESSNGVKVNGERVDRRHLMPGDHLSIASFRFLIEYEPEGTPPSSIQDLTSQSLLEKAGLEKIMNAEHTPGWLASDDDAEETGSRRYRLDDSDP